jgi:(p)ppGpp synthase/HD superfamily hydrolase
MIYEKLILSPRFEQALLYAATIHAGQARKGTTIPFLAHVMSVAGIALEHGADEDQAIGALLHDAVEKGGGPSRLDDIRARFGQKVAEIVEGCTEQQGNPKPPWRARKAAYIAHLPRVLEPVRLVSAADKLHNARAILRDLRALGDAVWDRYSGGKEGMLWYYRCLVQAFKTAGINPLVEELERVVTEIERLSRSETPSPEPAGPEQAEQKH